MAKRLMDRWLSILLAVAMVVQLCPTPALAEALDAMDDDGLTVLVDEVTDEELVIGAETREEAAPLPEGETPPLTTRRVPMRSPSW